MRPIEIAKAWFDMCRTGDEDRLAELATDDYLAHGPGGTGDRIDFVRRWPDPHGGHGAGAGSPWICR